MWQSQLDQLRDDHCLVADLPAQGQSDATPWVSLAATPRALAQLIRSRATQGTAHIVARSLDSYVGMQLMRDAPDVVEHALLSGLNVLSLPHLRLMNLLGSLMVPFIKTTLMIRMNAHGL